MSYPPEASNSPMESLRGQLFYANKRIEELEGAIKEHEDHYWQRLDEPVKRLGISRNLWKILNNEGN